MEHVGIEDGNGTMIAIEFYSNEKIVAVPRDATAFYQRGDWIDWRAMIAYGQRADLDGWVVTWAQRLADKIVALEKADDGIPEENKTGGKNGYWFAGDGVERKQIFGDNYGRLRKLKKKYDPDMVFHKWYPVVPAD